MDQFNQKLSKATIDAQQFLKLRSGTWKFESATLQMDDKNSARFRATTSLAILEVNNPKAKGLDDFVKRITGRQPLTIHAVEGDKGGYNNGIFTVKAYRREKK